MSQPLIPAAHPRTDPRVAKLAGIAATVLVGAAFCALATRRRDDPARSRRPVAEASMLQASAAALCASVLVDSAVEHYRGSFENPGMYLPLAVSAVAIVGGVDNAAGRLLRPAVSQAAYTAALTTGIAGLGFHAFNLVRRPGGLSWLNLFYAAPIGAPAALALAGALGLAAGAVERNGSERPLRVGRPPLARALSALIAVGLMGTVSEAALLHFRGSFQNPLMWVPVMVPPVSAVLMAKAALDDNRARPRTLTRAWLWLTAVAGIAGAALHVYGVSRAMGGWRNWQQNVIDGPPIPAPPSFSALALAGLAALRLRDRDSA